MIKDLEGTWGADAIFAQNCDGEMALERIGPIVLTAWLPAEGGRPWTRKAMFDFYLDGFKNAAGQSVYEAMVEAHHIAIEKIIKEQDLKDAGIE